MEGTVTVSLEPLMLMDGYQGQPYRITYQFGKDDWRSCKPNFPPRAGCSGPVEFFTISKRFQNLSQYLQVTLMAKKRFSSYLITIFLCPNLCPLCCTLLLIPLYDKIPALQTMGEQRTSYLDQVEHYKSLYWDWCV